MSDLSELLGQLSGRDRESSFTHRPLPVFVNRAGTVDEEGAHSPTCRCSSAPVFPPAGSIWYERGATSGDGALVVNPGEDEDLVTIPTNPTDLPTGGSFPDVPAYSNPTVPAGLDGAGFDIPASGDLGSFGMRGIDPDTGLPTWGVGNDGSVTGSGMQSVNGRAYLRFEEPDALVQGVSGDHGTCEVRITPEKVEFHVGDTTLSMRPSGHVPAMGDLGGLGAAPPSATGPPPDSPGPQFGTDSAYFTFATDGVQANVAVSATAFLSSSSRAVKERVETPAYSLLGLVLRAQAYEWSYLGETRRRVGPMAEDVPTYLRADSETGVLKLSQPTQAGILWGALAELCALAGITPEQVLGEDGQVTG